MTDKQQPEALALADICEDESRSNPDDYRWKAAAYLRRQQAELETLRAKLKTYEDLGDAADDVQLLRMGYAAARLEIESLRGQATAAQAVVSAGLVAKLEAAHRAVHPTAKAALIEEAAELLAAPPAQPVGAQQPGATYATLTYQWREKVAELADQLEKCGAAWIRTNGGTTYNVGRNDGAKFAASELRKVLADETEHAALRAAHGQAPAQAAPDVSGYVSEWAGGICTADEAMTGIAKLYGAQAAPVAVAGPSEAVKFTDQSTADPVEKARRYLTAMGDQRRNSAYFYDDGYPRRESAQDALATLAVLEQLAAAPTTQPALQLPERDASVPAEQQGLFRKFEVRRVDGTDKPGGKHHGCTYFVLDVDHDPCARPALAAYAAACEATHPALAADLLTKWGAAPTTQPTPAAQGDALDTIRLDWLDADESRCVFHLGKSWYTRPSYGMPYRKRASLREAIDAARAAQEGK